MTTASSSSGAEKKKKKVSSGVAVIKETIEADPKRLLTLFSKSTDVENLTEVETSISSAATLWGKKKGALLSCGMVPDADRVVAIVSQVMFVKKLISGFKGFLDNTKASSSNGFCNLLVEFEKQDFSAIASIRYCPTAVL